MCECVCARVGMERVVCEGRDVEVWGCEKVWGCEEVWGCLGARVGM